MKRFLVRTGVGGWLLGARERVEMLRAALRSPDDAGTLANDQLSTRLITRLCQPGRGFLDVGAHIGSVIAEARRRDASIKCIAVEAMPGKAAHLRRSFPGLIVHECAAGDSTGEVSFYVDTVQTGYSSLSRPAQDHPIQEIHVPMKRVDDLVPAGVIDAMKIDVEGAELAVLRGSAGRLADSRPTIMFESGPPKDEAGMEVKKALRGFLGAHGYAVLVPNRVAHLGPGLSEEGFCESHWYPRRTTNYFAVANERRDEIRERARRALGVGHS